MIKHGKKGLGIIAGFFILGGPAWLLGQSKPPAKAVAHHSPTKPAEPLSSEKVIRFIKEKMGVSDKITMTMDPFHESTDPEFLESSVTSDDGLNTKTSKQTRVVGVSKDSHYLVFSYVPVGNSPFFAIGPADPKVEIDRRFRDLFHFPESYTVTVGASHSSPFPNFLTMPITLADGKNKSEPEAYISRDHHFVVLGDIYDLRVNPRREALHLLVLQNQGETGTKNAPVTIVEFADLECPTCARAHDFLEKTLLPNYPGKIRLIFKDFPLPMHEWAMPAAIASQCAYKINPADFEAFRTLVFQHQSEIDVFKSDTSKVRDMLLDYGQQVGLDKLQLAGCVDSKASLPRVEENLKEGKALGVNSTPTFYINGRIQIGAEPEFFTHNVDEALQAAKKK